jgi:hypothetical protein
MTGKDTTMPAEDNGADEDMDFFGPPRPDERFISYRLRPEERPDGLDVRYVVKVVSGDRAKEIDARQAKAMMDLLRWCRDYRQQQEQAAQDQAGPPAGPRPDQAATRPDAPQK